LVQKKIAEITSEGKEICKAFFVLNATIEIITGRKISGVMSAKIANTEPLCEREPSWSFQNYPF